MSKACTPDQIETAIVKEEYLTLGIKTTTCVLTLKNGFEVIGTSACVDPTSYDIDKGKPLARQRALDKVWELEGYLLQSS